MRKITFLLIAIVFIFFAFGQVYAIDLGKSMIKDTAIKAGYAESTTATTFAEIIGTVIKVALSFVGVIFLALMVYAGYLWMTAQGEEEPIKKAQNIIKSSIIGLIITVGAYSITSFVVPKILERTTGPTGGAPTTGAPPGTVTCCRLCETKVFGSCNESLRVPNISETDCDKICKSKDKTLTGGKECESYEMLYNIPASECP